MIRIDVDKPTYPYQVYRKGDPRHAQRKIEAQRTNGLVEDLMDEFKQYALMPGTHYLAYSNGKIIITAQGLVALQQSNFKAVINKDHPILSSMEQLVSKNPAEELRRLLKGEKTFFNSWSDDMTKGYRCNVSARVDKELVEKFFDAFKVALKTIFPDGQFVENNGLGLLIPEEVYLGCIGLPIKQLPASGDITDLKSFLLEKMIQLGKSSSTNKSGDLAQYFNEITANLSISGVDILFNFLLSYRANENNNATPMWQQRPLKLDIDWQSLIGAIRIRALEKLENVTKRMDDREAICLLTDCRRYSLFDLPNSFFDKIGRTSALVKIDELKKIREDNLVVTLKKSNG